MSTIVYKSVLDLAAPANLAGFIQSAKGIDGLAPVDALVCALKCAHEGGEMIRNAIRNRDKVGKSDPNTKCSDADLVTETDVAIEKAIRAHIKATFPNHLFVGEEGTGAAVPEPERRGKYIWIVDPIDGTTNFVHGFPVVTVSIAVAYGDDCQLGVVYNPLMNELWFAWKGCGAFMKQTSGQVLKISTSGCQSISKALISTGFGVTVFRRSTPAVAEQAALRDIVEHNTRILMTESRDIRRIGSAACDMCFVAMGRTDCYFEFGIKEWDIAAGLVILHEAGGASSTVGGLRPYSIRGRNVLVASTEKLRQELCSKLIDKNAVALIEAIEK